jgi:hypothetical protein
MTTANMNGLLVPAHPPINDSIFTTQRSHNMEYHIPNPPIVNPAVIGKGIVNMMCFLKTQQKGKKAILVTENWVAVIDEIKACEFEQEEPTDSQSKAFSCAAKLPFVSHYTDYYSEEKENKKTNNRVRSKSEENVFRRSSSRLANVMTSSCQCKYSQRCICNDNLSLSLFFYFQKPRVRPAPVNDQSKSTSSTKTLQEKQSLKERKKK